MKKLLLSITFAIAGLAVKAQEARPAVTTDSLSVFRSKIDALDSSIIVLLGARMQVAEDVGRYKQVHHIGVVQHNRFQEVLNKAIRDGAAQGLSEKFIRALYHEIHEESIRKQEALKR